MKIPTTNFAELCDDDSIFNEANQYGKYNTKYTKMFMFSKSQCLSSILNEQQENLITKVGKGGFIKYQAVPQVFSFFYFFPIIILNIIYHCQY